MALKSEDARDNAETAKHKRPKYWPELNESEKLERMREVVKHQDNRIARLNQQLDSLFRKLRQHTHTANGYTVLPIDFISDDTFGANKAQTSSDTEVYF